MFTRRLGAAVLAAVTLISLTACGNSDKKPDAKTKPTATAPASTSPSETPTPDASPTPGTPKITQDPNGKTNYCQGNQKPFTGEAADKFGAEKVMAGYCEMVKLTMEQSFVPNMLRQESDFRAVEFTIPGQYMTAAARKDWDAQVNKVVTGTGDQSEVWSMMFVGLNYGEGDAYRYYPDSSAMPTVLNQSFTPATTSVDTKGSQPRLVLSFSVSADLVMTDGKDPYLIHATKKMTYWLVDNGTAPDKPWLIDGYSSEPHFDKPVKHPEIAIAE